MKKLKTKKEVDNMSVVISTLAKFKRWLYGRGRKYVAGQSTVDVELACGVIGIAIDSMKHRLGHEEFKRLVCIAQCADPRGAEDKKVMSAAKRIVRYIDKAEFRQGRR